MLVSYDYFIFYISVYGIFAISYMSRRQVYLDYTIASKYLTLVNSRDIDSVDYKVIHARFMYIEHY